MRQLRPTDRRALSVRLVEPGAIDLGPSRRRLLVMPLVMFLAAVAGGYAGSLVLRPPVYAILVLTAAGAASAAFLLVAIPTQTILIFRRLFLRLRLASKRRRLRAMLQEVRSRLAETDSVGSQTTGKLNDLGIADYLLGATEEAERLLAQALELEPESPTLLNNLGVILAESRRHDQAAEMFARACALDHLDEARANLGLIAPLADRPEPFEHLIVGKPKQADALSLNNMGVFYRKRGELDLAREWFLRAVKEDSHMPYAWANLGVIAYQQGRLREAVTHLISAEREAPADARIANNLGVALAAAGKPAWSLEQLQRARGLEPANLGIRINILCLEALEGHLDAAMRGLRAVTTGPYHRADAYYNLAVLQLAAGDPEGAAVSAAAAIEEGKQGADAYTNLAVALWEQGRRAEALPHFQAANEAPDANPQTASNLGRALMLEGDPERAIQVLNPAREKWRADSGLAFDLATALLSSAAARYRPDMTAAERRDFFVELHRSHAGLEAALRRGPDAPIEALVNMGLYLYLREEFVSAAEYFEQAAKAAPEMLELRFLAGTAYGRAADQHAHQLEDGRRTLTSEGLELVRKAVPHLEAACNARDPLPDALYNLGRCLYALEEYEKALELFRKALRVENSEEMNTLAALAAAKQARQWQEAVRTQSLMSESRKEILANQARKLLDTAVYYFRQALVHNELNPSLHGNMGLAYMLRNQEHDVEAALRHWQRMRAIAGASFETRYAEFTQIQSVEHASRVQFDDTDVACRDLKVFEWVVALSPVPAGLHYVLEPVSVQQPWRLVATDQTLQRALRLRDQIADGERALARLEV